jgi:uncharacterized membrane protein
VKNLPLSSTAKDELGDELLEQLAVGALGGALIGAAHRRGTVGLVMRLAGLALIGMAARPTVKRAIRQAGERRRNIRLKTSVEVERPVSLVFCFFKDFENYPRVIGALRSVRDFEDGRSRWEAYSPSGEVIGWDAVVTKYVPNSVLAWQSVPRSAVDVHVIIRFTPLGGERTRIDYEASYLPGRTKLSDAVRALLGPAPQDVLRSDLEHARFYLESLEPPVPEETPAVEG